jgi:hypothetical protein
VERKSELLVIRFVELQQLTEHNKIDQDHILEMLTLLYAPIQNTLLNFRGLSHPLQNFSSYSAGILS